MKFEKETKKITIHNEVFQVEMVETQEGPQWVVYDSEGNQILQTEDADEAYTFI